MRIPQQCTQCMKGKGPDAPQGLPQVGHELDVWVGPLPQGMVPLHLYQPHEVLHISLHLWHILEN